MNTYTKNVQKRNRLIVENKRADTDTYEKNIDHVSNEIKRQQNYRSLQEDAINKQTPCKPWAPLTINAPKNRITHPKQWQMAAARSAFMQDCTTPRPK